MRYWIIATLSAYEFLSVFHCNYGRILYRFRNKARYSSKNANFSYNNILFANVQNIKQQKIKNLPEKQYLSFKLATYSLLSVLIINN